MISAKTRQTTNSTTIFKELLGFMQKQGTEIGSLEIAENTLLYSFLQGISSGQWKNDEEACIELYRHSSSVQFNKLKNRLRVKLLNAISANINPQVEYKSDIDLIYKKLNQEYVVFNLLQSQNYITSGAYLGEHIIATSIRYGFSEFILKVVAELIEHFSIFELNPSKVEYYINVQSEYLETIKWEQKSYLAYAKMMNLFVKEFSPGEKALIIADEFLPLAKPYVGELNSVKFHLRYYLIKVFKYYSLKMFIEMDHSAREAVLFLQTLKYPRLRTVNMFLKKRLEANLILGNTQLCQSLLSSILANSDTGNTNWFNTLEIETTLKVHNQEYKGAIISFLSGKNNINFPNLPKTTSKRWGLLEAYINFLQLTGVAPESPTMSRYRINRFINDTPQYSEDKKGRNIQLIIAQLLFYIIDKNWDKMEEKIDALQKYGTRYLRKNELFRSQVFIKMLLEIPRRMYHPQAIIRHTARYRKRLEEMAPNIDLNGSTLEIIPYEHLWELIIQNIVPPKYTRKTKLTEPTKSP